MQHGLLMVWQWGKVRVMHAAGIARGALGTHGEQACINAVCSRSSRGQWWIMIMLVVTSVLVAGCAPYGGRERSMQRGVAPASALVVADWDDLDASVTPAGAAAELALLSRRDEVLGNGCKQATYTFLASDDRLIELTVTQREPKAGEKRPGGLVLRATGKPFRDAQREGHLLKAAAMRLEKLAGREWAPL